jgi:hypothetical protein
MPLRTTDPGGAPVGNQFAVETRPAVVGCASPRRAAPTSHVRALRTCSWPLGLFGMLALIGAVERLFAPRAHERSGPRWIDLVEIDEGKAGRYQNMVEDLDQSRAAIEPILVGQSSGEVKAW